MREGGMIRAQDDEITEFEGEGGAERTITSYLLYSPPHGRYVTRFTPAGHFTTTGDEPMRFRNVSEILGELRGHKAVPRKGLSLEIHKEESVKSFVRSPVR